MQTKFSSLPGIALLLISSSMSGIHAQEAEPNAVIEKSGSSFGLEEVIVTANRREENLQEVPMSVSAFSGDFFKETGATDFSSLEQYTPSLKITPGADSRSTSIRIRGIGSVGSNSGIDPSVGIFIDGVYQGRAGMTISDLIDIERVEVLRGPQGTLYGKNTAAGAISIMTKKPSPEFEAETELVMANNERVEMRGMVNIPFGDSGHGMRVSAFGIDGDHLYENSFEGAEVKDLNNAHKWGTKAKFLFDFESIGEFIFSVDYSKEDTDCCGFAVIDYEGLSTLNAPLTNNPSENLQAILGPNDTNGDPILQYESFEDNNPVVTASRPKADPFGDDYWFDGDLYNKVEVGGTALEWNYQLESDHTLTFINAWRKYKSESAFDGDFTAYDAVAGIQDVDMDQYSSEFRIASPGGETIDYQAGVYAYYSNMDSEGNFIMGVPLIEKIPGGLDNLYPNGSNNIDDNTYKTTSYALFGQMTWNISDSWSTTLGLRYTYEKKERDGSQITLGYVSGNSCDADLDIPPVAGPCVELDDDREDDDISPALNVRYFVNEDLMTYASISRGFKSGGYDQRRVTTTENGEFDEETATNYELGWKGTWIDRRLQVNGTFYFVDYEDFQSQTFDGASIKVTNAGSMESYGMELETVFAATANLTLGSAIGYNHAEYKDFDKGQCTVDAAFNDYYIVQGAQGGSPGQGNPPCTRDLEGKPVDNTPEWTVSSYLQHNYDLTDNLVTIARLEHNFTDSFYLDQDLDGNLKNDTVNLVNMRLTLANVDRVWEVAVWGRNLLQEEYYSFGLDIPTVGGYAGVTAPDITYGLTMRYNFY
jgi:iron complex outermembrane receptor protein